MSISKLFIVILSIPILLSCGGGDGAEPACAAGSGFIVSAKWSSNGTLDTAVFGKVGVPLIAKPVLSGVPVSCVNLSRYEWNTWVAALPKGLTVNSSTGEISGTPVEEFGTFGMLLSLTFPGFQSISILTGMYTRK